METTPLYNNSNRDIEIIKTILQSGNSVELPAIGFSMFPTLRPGDVILVRPLTRGEVPVNGSVVVCVKNGVMVRRFGGAMDKDKRQKSQDKSEENNDNSVVLVMHRLVEIIDKDSENPLFITRGDSRPEPDEPWSFEQLLGEAVSFKRSGKTRQVKKSVPGYWKYRYNMRVLWIRNMGMRIWNRTAI